MPFFVSFLQPALTDLTAKKIEPTRAGLQIGSRYTPVAIILRGDNTPPSDAVASPMNPLDARVTRTIPFFGTFGTFID
jgi:hypothetical protein